MKPKMLALIMVLTVASWSQTATQTSPSTPQQSTVPAEKAKCACSEKMASADAKEAPSCCAHHMKESADNKEMSSCCGGKDAKSCMKGDKDKTAAACCKDSCGKDKTASVQGGETCGKKCGKHCEQGCCAAKGSETTAKSCGRERLHS
jgi:hypothetical protein